MDGNPVFIMELLALETPTIPIWYRCFEIVAGPIDESHAKFQERLNHFHRQCAAGAFLDAAMSLIPTDRGLRMHRYRNKRSGWASVTGTGDFDHFPMNDPKNPEAKTAMEFFARAETLEAALCIVALHIAWARK